MKSFILAGAKTKSLQTQISNHLPIPYFTVNYRPFWVRGAKHLIQRDENGKITFNSKKTRISQGTISPGKLLDKINEKKFLDEAKQQREKLGYKDVKFKKQSIDLPRKCPSCNHLGSPSLVKWKEQYRSNRNKNYQEPITNETTRLIYNHSKTKPKTCLIGKVTLSNPITIHLKKGLPVGILGYSSRIGTFQ